MTTHCREGNGSHKEAWALWILSTSWNSWQVRTAETFPQILNSNGVMIFTDFHLASNVILMRHTKLKDDPTVRWREELVSDIILRQVPVKHQVTDKLMVGSNSRWRHCPSTLASPLTGMACPGTGTTSASTMPWPALPWRTGRGVCSASHR